MTKFIVSLDLESFDDDHPSLLLLSKWNATPLQNSLWLVDYDEGMINLSAALSAVLSAKDGLFVHPYVQMIHRVSSRNERGDAADTKAHRPVKKARGLVPDDGGRGSAIQIRFA